MTPPSSWAARTSQSSFAGQAHRWRARRDGRRVAQLGEPARLAHERVLARERAGIDELEEDRRAPFLRLVGPTVAGQARRQRLDQQGEGEALVAEVMPPSGSRAPRRSPKSTAGSSVARPSASTSHGPGRRSPSSWRRFVIAFVVVLMLTSRSTGAPPVGKPAASGLGVMREATPPWGVTPPRRIGAGEQDHEPVVRDRLQVGLQAADVVAAADDDRDDWVLGEPLARRRDRPLDEPGPRQAPPVPGEGGAGIAERVGLALAGHAPGCQLVEVASEHVEAVRVVAEEVGLDQDLRHDLRALRREPRPLQQPRRKPTQRARRVSRIAQAADDSRAPARTVRSAQAKDPAPASSVADLARAARRRVALSRPQSVAFSSRSSPPGPTRVIFTGTMPSAWVEQLRQGS